MRPPRVTRTWALVLLSLLGLVGAGGCNTGMAERSAEGRLRRRLPELIGPAESYRVNIRAASDISIMQGRLRAITIEGKRVRIGNQWPVDHLLVTLDKVRVDMHRETVESVGAARFEATIRPGTLVRYLEGGDAILRGVNVTLEPGSVTITGEYLLVGLWTTFRLSGSLGLLDHSRIGFQTSGARAAGIPVPGAIRRYLEQRLNPVLDVTHVLVPIELTAVVVRPDGVTVTGTPDLTDVSLLNRP